MIIWINSLVRHKRAPHPSISATAVTEKMIGGSAEINLCLWTQYAVCRLDVIHPRDSQK